MTNKKQVPQPLFDTMANINQTINYDYLPQNYCHDDINQARNFLKCYIGSQGTFNSYRREIERLIHWCALIQNNNLQQFNRDDAEAFVRFCHQPPKHWIGTSKPPRFINKLGQRRPNNKWRPFIATISKSAYREGLTPSISQFKLSHGSTRELFAILQSFFNYLLQEEYVNNNPIRLIRQKSQFIRKQQVQNKIRRLSDLQWQTVIQTARHLADNNPEQHERTLFIMSALYSMYLRISELTSTERWEPVMNHFHRDNDNHWWFTTVGKGNKQRDIAVSQSMMNALKRWRQFLGLSPTPSPADETPLLPKNRGKGTIRSTNTIRKIVQYCFDQAFNQLIEDGLEEEAHALNEATVHWLRHTGISDDVKTRPREHVRDDAGHSSSAITDRYIDIERRERYTSAKNKLIAEDDIK